MSLTLDASVFISSARPQEIHHPVSLSFVNRLFTLDQPIVCPSLVLPECAATIDRQTNRQFSVCSPTHADNFSRAKVADRRIGHNPRPAGSHSSRINPPARGGCRLRRRRPGVRHDTDYLGRRDAGTLPCGCPDPNADRLAGGTPDRLGTRYNGLQSHLQLQARRRPAGGD